MTVNHQIKVRFLSPEQRYTWECTTFYDAGSRPALEVSRYITCHTVYGVIGSTPGYDPVVSVRIRLHLETGYVDGVSDWGTPLYTSPIKEIQ
jgi:hypothetical protein